MNGRTPFAYVAVAGVCVVLHNAVLIIGDLLGIPLWLGVMISFGIVASVGYVLHGLFLFRQPLAVRRLAKYAVAMSANIPLAFVTTWFCRSRGRIADGACRAACVRVHAGSEFRAGPLGHYSAKRTRAIS